MTPFEWIGGEEKVKQLVERFYDLMDLEPGTPNCGMDAQHAGLGRVVEPSRCRAGTEWGFQAK